MKGAPKCRFCKEAHYGNCAPVIAREVRQGPRGGEGTSGVVGEPGGGAGQANVTGGSAASGVDVRFAKASNGARRDVYNAYHRRYKAEVKAGTRTVKKRTE